jgi:predicted HicB family RNase H-like nuclease
MAKNGDYTNKLQGFADRVKTEPVQLPVQKVMPVQTATTKEQQLNVWIPKDLMKRLKVKGAEADKSLKEMVIEALSQFL